MTTLPFDEKLSALLDSWCESDDAEGWRRLMRRDGEIFQYLNSNGYSRQSIEKKLDDLQEMPVKELLRIGLEVEHMFNAVKQYFAHSSSPEVFDATAELCNSEDADERDLGVSLLRREPGRAFASDSKKLLLEMLNKEDDEYVLESLIYATNDLMYLKQISDEERAPLLLSLASHDADIVRQAVAATLSGVDSKVVEALINLSRDPVGKVRNWATFTLVQTVMAVRTEVYSEVEIENFPDLKDVFMNRINDENHDVHLEAMKGLALYKDPRVLEPLKKELQSDDVSSSALEAASTMADPELYPILKGIKQKNVWWDHEGLNEAIANCNPDDMS